MKDASSDVEIAYESFGDRAEPPVLLVMGLATQMLAWQTDFCTDLAGRGHFVVRFDNRDVGLSTHLHDGPPYTLSDMARDTTGLMDALELASAHLVGLSMGGMIAQTVAIEHPEKTRSLTSIMSTTGNPEVGGATEEAVAALMAPPPQTREQAIERSLATYRVIGSPGFELDEPWLRERAGLAFDRAHDPAGVVRQMAAVQASGDRTEQLRDLELPTLVIHGADDPLIQPSGGEATAAAIPGAELKLFEGMGHDFPRPLWPEVTDLIARVVERGERLRRRRG